MSDCYHLHSDVRRGQMFVHQAQAVVLKIIEVLLSVQMFIKRLSDSIRASAIPKTEAKEMARINTLAPTHLP